jgi:hypothetical protein
MDGTTKRADCGRYSLVLRAPGYPGFRIARCNFKRPFFVALIVDAKEEYTDKLGAKSEICSLSEVAVDVVW